MKTLIILNEGPYGSERTYNGLRLANSLSKQPNINLKIFLIGDAASCARRGQQVPRGYYNIETMLGVTVKNGGQIGVCGSCMDARGIGESDLVDGAHRSSMDELTAWSWTQTKSSPSDAKATLFTKAARSQCLTDSVCFVPRSAGRRPRRLRTLRREVRQCPVPATLR